ncbi:hypothetical protein PHYBOEH_001549 [Phytophthora boehmeriae]|uniref:Cytochrome P450 n=1 Tax=Phytophthora boehmeriae TaxID=109152 RepID=A0A8T1WTP5_9STRA|nr:hypothetical protein PHYBOEH_001549 [Phytophthora boehmeriae]
MLSWLFDYDDPVKKLGLLVLGVVVGAVVVPYCLPNDATDKKLLKQRESVTPGAQGPVRVPFLPSVPVVGHVVLMAYHAGRFLDWVTEVFLARDGAPFMLRLPFQRNLIFTANPEHYEHVMKTQYDNFLKGDHIYDLLVDLLGDSILIVEDEEWKFHRRVFVNLFSSRALREHMAPIIQKHIHVLQRVLTETEKTKQPIDFFNACGRFTLDSFGEIAFGFDMSTLTLTEDQHPFELVSVCHCPLFARDACQERLDLQDVCFIFFHTLQGTQQSESLASQGTSPDQTLKLHRRLELDRNQATNAD